MAQTMTSAAPGSLEKTNFQATEAPRRLSKRELAGLMKGEKINIFTGEPPNANFLFPVPINLVTYFSRTWRNEVVEKKAKVLYIFAHKDAIKLVIEWMAAGGMDSTARGSIPYPANDVLKLLCLNKLVAYLEITPLVDQTLKNIDNMTRKPVSFEQMIRLLSVANIPSRTHEVLERNLVKWVGTFSSNEWHKKCSQAPVDSAHKTALTVLGTLRTAAERNREERESSKRASQGNNQSRRTFRRGAPFLDNGTRLKNATRDGHFVGNATKDKTTRLDAAQI